MKRYQVSPALAAAVMHFAPKYVVLDDAPSTFEEIRAYRKEHGVYAVWSGGSEQTIWPTPGHNYAFRALHDGIHDRFGHSLTIYGEQATARDTEKYLRRVAPHLTEEDYRAMWFEVVGQVLYEAHHGEFPQDQAAFIGACMRNGSPLLNYVIQSRKY